jgi:hypothetical protein
MAYDDIVLKGYIYNDAGTGVSGATVKVYAGDSADTSTSGSALDDTTTSSDGMWTLTSSNSATTANNRLDVEITTSGSSSKRRIKYRDSIQVENIDAEKIIVRAIEAGDAAVHFFADEADDAGDYWRINASASNTFAIGSDKAVEGTIIDYLTITNGADAASSLTTILGKLTVGINDTGADVQFFGATANTYMLWDENTDDLVLTLGAELYFYDAAGGEHIKSDGTDMTIYAGNDLNLTAVTDINIPNNVGLTFGNDGEKIEGDGTNLVVASSGTLDMNSGGVLTLDSGAAINIEPAGSSVILLDGTISIDAGVVTGATSITSTAFLGTIDGVVGGNTPAAITGTTIAANTNFTRGDTVITDGVITDSTGLALTANVTLTDGSYNLDIASHDGTNGLALAGTIVTATAAQINVLTGATAGSSVVSKAVVLDSNGDFEFQDSDVLAFGDSADLQISHNGSNSYIKDSGTGSLLLWSDAADGEVKIIGISDGSETMADFNVGGSVDLYYDNAVKLATHNTGVEITGSLEVATIDHTNGTLAMTVASGGGVTFAQDVTIGGTTPSLTIGDGGNEDTGILFNGDGTDTYIGFDAGTNDLMIGTGTTIGSNSFMTFSDTHGNIGIGHTPTSGSIGVQYEDDITGSNDQTTMAHIGIGIAGGQSMNTQGDLAGDGAYSRAGTLDVNRPVLTINGTDSVSDAFTLRIANEPQAGTRAWALWVDAGKSRFDGLLQADGGVVFNEGDADVDFRVETNDVTSMLQIDGGHNTIGIGRDGGGNNLISVRPGGATLTAANVEGSAFYIEQATQNFDNASSTLAVQSALSVRAQTYTGDNDTLTLTEAASIYAEVPAAGSGVGIGTAYSILATGVIKCASVTEASDIAFKENIQNIDSAIDTVKKLRPVTFDWKEDKKSAAGFVAQDVEEVLPYVVDGISGRKGIKSTGILAQVTKALQESIEKIEVLEKQVEELQGV